MLRSRSYLGLLILAAIVGVPVSAVAYGFLALVDYLQKEIFTHLPHGLGFQTEPAWWPLPVLVFGGLLAGLAIRYLPGRGGPSPAGPFRLHGAPAPAELPGVILAALATLVFGAVLGPEMPLILVGGGLAALSVRLARREVPDQARTVIAAAGSFAAISTLLGSPLTGAFLLMEASGLGGPLLGLVLVPGLLAAGVGSLIFTGLDAWTGLGTFPLAIPGLPHFGHPDIAEFGWAVVIGVAAALIGPAISWLAQRLEGYVIRSPLIMTPLAGLTIAALAIAYAQGTGKGSSQVLFSGQTALPSLIQHGATYTIGTLLLLMACKGAGLLRLARQFPRRAGVPGDVHRRGRAASLCPTCQGCHWWQAWPWAPDVPAAGDRHRNTRPGPAVQTLTLAGERALRASTRQRASPAPGVAAPAAADLVRYGEWPLRYGTSMRAMTVIPGRQGSVALTDMPEPPLDDGPVLVQTQAIGVCGTDLEIINGDYGWAPPGEERLIIGHESLGKVIEAAPGTGLSTGDLVVGIVRRPRPGPVPCMRGRGLGHVRQRPVHRARNQGAARLRLRAVPHSPRIPAGR